MVQLHYLRKSNFKIDNEIKFADDPELTKTLYLTPSHFDQFFQIFLHF